MEFYSQYILWGWRGVGEDRMTRLHEEFLSIGGRRGRSLWNVNTLIKQYFHRCCWWWPIPLPYQTFWMNIFWDLHIKFKKTGMMGIMMRMLWWIWVNPVGGLNIKSRGGWSASHICTACYTALLKLHTNWHYVDHNLISHYTLHNTQQRPLWWGYNAERMLIWGQITPKLAPDLTAMPTALYVPRAMLSVYFNRLCSAWCSKGTTQTRGQEQSGQWLVGTYQAFSPRSTHLHLGQRRQHNSAIQIRDSSFTWSKMWMHTAAQCGVVNWCERSFVRQSPIFLCNLAISPSCAVCGAR